MSATDRPEPMCPTFARLDCSSIWRRMPWPETDTGMPASVLTSDSSSSNGLLALLPGSLERWRSGYSAFTNGKAAHLRAIDIADTELIEDHNQQSPTLGAGPRPGIPAAARRIDVRRVIHDAHLDSPTVIMIALVVLD